MNRRISYVALVVLILAVVACTCGPLSGITSAAEQAAEEAVDGALQEASETLEAVELEVEEQGEVAVEEAVEPEEQPAEGQEQAGESIDFTLGESGLENLSSYEYIQIIDFSETGTDGQPTQTHMEMHIIHQAEPFINSMRTEVTDSATGEKISTWMVFIDGTNYTEMTASDGRTCFAMPGDPSDLEAYDTSYYDLDPGEFSDIDSQADFVVVSDNEDVNGIPSTHYRAENVNISTVESGSVDVWIANDGGYTTRMILEGVNTDTDLGDGEFSMTWELVSANQPVSVTPPADCQSFDMPTE